MHEVTHCLAAAIAYCNPPTFVLKQGSGFIFVYELSRRTRGTLRAIHLINTVQLITISDIFLI